MSSEVEDALAYFRPHWMSHGPIILTADKMREHLAIIEARLSRTASVAVTDEMYFKARAAYVDRAPVGREAHDGPAMRAALEAALGSAAAGTGSGEWRDSP